MRIAVIRLSALGDIVHTVPAVARLRERRPDAHITWLAEPAGAKLLGLFAVADEVVQTNLRQPGNSARLRALAALLRSQRGRFDAVLDFQGLLKSAVLARLLGGTRCGFHRRNLREPAAAVLYSRRAGYFPEQEHVIRKNMHLLSALGIEPGAIRFPWRAPAPQPEVDAFLAEWNPSRRPWVALNVGGGWPTKVLPFDRLLQTARRLQPEFGVLLLWGTPAERETAQRLAAASGARLAPPLDFAALLAVLRCCALLVSGDTLPLHLADAAGVRSVGLFGPTSPQRNGPLLPASTVLVDPQPCGFCYKRKCDTMECLGGIGPERIVEAVRVTYAKRD